ncbi:MAG: hypothetical protein A3F94_02895 [Candidatus Spechtbacteria bacterium RIFCSPLOWO2_12_FULL_38_22]|uniref:Membrane protein insertion efficiency factor YidD n=1 Tax=Candidatus Spechtbacteria bacterium RIFCSPLOWO2_12_FULL_38_22 TaxID=1802165 RepID=A0A1G2HIP2_9BACT|nr:MAG: hypothetical protein A2728_02630 [Candidatus Spechtbacteria bacterium RIFCSPHIGHO2_01_FULL_38_11]OGZ60111.1 MAG: hypothetical protein A3E58_01765 [Candidatus Spechtbacteria bacterium RIFCSPHIGHO2_12_FULL_38_30]OGZ61092.1 MAG: hypothetical protein A3A00_03080 [Candidatus Spechtbacteria bacterium RIFCSPLOWO2_01_FULL_38_20]OGZ62269.1 MAG: hypothetical protein A3F94_02895 [Candidatus Spechtbacteria bacterium RIFCSPLOWO2_12_FULL_38_22]
MTNSWAKRTPSFLFLGLITVYQWTLSPDHGVVSFFTVGQCKFRPTCSQYTKIAIKERGALHGLKAGFAQLKKCH